MDRLTPRTPGASGFLRLDHACDIAAPLTAVWDVVSDIAGWPAWTPTVSAALQVTPGPIAAGTVFLIRQPLQRAARWRITDWDPGRGFAWDREAPGLGLRAEHHLRATGDGTRSHLRLRVTGRAAPLLRPVLALALRLENRALKARLERGSAPPGNGSA